MKLKTIARRPQLAKEKLCMLLRIRVKVLNKFYEMFED